MDRIPSNMCENKKIVEYRWQLSNRNDGGGGGGGWWL